MSRLVGKMDTKEQKAEALKYHALYMGIGTQFLQAVVPQAQAMPGELMEIDRKAGDKPDKNTATVLADVWLGKVFKEIQKEVEKYEKSR